MLITLPCIRQGWLADDLIHRKLFLTSPLSVAMRDMFVFADPSRNREWMDLGAMPWWTADGLRIMFFRPVAVLTHWLDYKLWPASIALMHVQNVLWYGGVCFAAAVLYRRLMGSIALGGLAAFLFTVDIVHLGSVAWVANRNVLLSALFGLLALLAHDRWRREGRRCAAFVAPAWLALSVFSAEAGAATGAYLAAYALCLDRGSLRRRLASLLPYVVVGVLWQIAFRCLGCGIRASGFYMEPASEPIRFAGGLLERGPILLLGQGLGLIPLAYNLVSAPAARIIWLAAAAFVILAGIWLSPLIRSSRTARFWALGMLLAVVPACSIRLLSGRLLVFAGLGAMGLTAEFIAGFANRSSWVPQGRARRVPAGVFCCVLAVLHAVLSPVLVPVMAAMPNSLQETITRVTDLGPLPDAEEQDVVIVNAPSPFHFIYMPGLRHLRGEPVPAHTRILAEGYASVKVTREDAHTVVVRPASGYQVRPGTGVGDPQAPPTVHLAYMHQHVGTFFRSQYRPMPLGYRVALSGVQWEVTALTDDRRPQEVRARFARPLEHPSIKWLWWDWDTEGYQVFTPPPVGSTVTLPGPTRHRS